MRISFGFLNALLYNTNVTIKQKQNMEEKAIISSAILHGKLIELEILVHDSIINLMKSKGVTKVDLMVDQNGRNHDDEDYDEDWVFEHRVWVDCYGKYANEGGYVSEVEIDEYDRILLTAEGEDSTYSNVYVSQNVETFIEVLERLETILK